MAGEGRALVAFDPGRVRVWRYNHPVLSRQQYPEVFPLAACPRLAENSRLGFETVASTSRWGSGFSISSSTLGFQASLYDGRVGSRTTGKERDSESGNDYFGARYYSSAMGRFMSPDPKLISKQRILDPQQWNMYAYTRNNPLVAIDPDGKELRFVNEAQAQHAVADFRAGVAPSQRSAIGYGTKNGNWVLQVDQKASKAAGLNTNLGRLGFVASSDNIAQLKYVDQDEKFTVKVNGKVYSDSFMHEYKTEGVMPGGETLFPDSGNAPKGLPLSTDSNVTQVYVNSSNDDPMEVTHEVDVHVFQYFQTDDINQSVHGDPATDKTTQEVQSEERQNEKEPN